MGYSEFLLGIPNAPPPSLGETINSLQDASALFMIAFRRGDGDQINRATSIAMRAFDFIVGEIMRTRDRQKADGVYTGSCLEAEMNVIVGKMVSPVTRNDQIAVRSAGPGNGRLPANVGVTVDISIEKTLNKIKHRHPTIANFRIQGDRHIFVICPDKPGGSGPDSVVEFDVDQLCNQCRRLSTLL